jgi:hypothetical protein
VIASLLYRLGTLLLVGDVLYLVLFEAFLGGADGRLFRMVLAAAAVCFVGGLVTSIVFRAKSGMQSPTCPTCGKRVARGREYCKDHLVETINRYRDQERQKGN